MGRSLRGELGAWMSMAEGHWKEHRPEMCRELKQAGRLTAALEFAAQQTELEMHQLMRAGLTYHQAWEAVRETYLLLPPEDSETPDEVNPATKVACDLLGEILDLFRAINQTEMNAPVEKKSPTTREMLDHVEKKRAEGYRPNRSVFKKVNRQIEQEVAEFLATVSKRRGQS